MLITVWILSVIPVRALADLFGKYFIAYINYILSFNVSTDIIFGNHRQSNDKY